MLRRDHGLKAIENGALTVADFTNGLPATRALLIRTEAPTPMKAEWVCVSEPHSAAERRR